MKPLIIIGLIGKIGSGKDTVSKYLARVYNFEEIVMGDIVREIAKKRGLSLNRETLQKLQASLVKKYGIDYFAKKVVKKIKNGLKKGKVKFVINGLRRFADVETLLKYYPNSFIVEIYCPKKIRYKRLKKRKRVGDPLTFKQFLMQEKKEEELFKISKVIKKYAKYKIDNSKNVKTLYKNVDDLLLRILKEL